MHGPAEAVELVGSWPVDHVAAAIVDADGAGTHRVVARSGEADRPFTLASLTKPMTAWATLVAVEEGVVTLDDAVGPPGCTLEHLLCHAGGLPFDGADPVAPPATRRIYSNTGYELAAAHVERAAEMPFGDYLVAAVFEPLGMTTARLDGSAAHGVVATLDDAVRFVAELLEPRLLAASTAAAARSPRHPELSGIVPGVGRFDPCPWGLGPELAGDKRPHWSGTIRSAGALGHFGGAGTMMLADPAAGRGVVALTDRPFDEWAADALGAWSELNDAALGATS